MYKSQLYPLSQYQGYKDIYIYMSEKRVKKEQVYIEHSKFPSTHFSALKWGYLSHAW